MDENSVKLICFEICGEQFAFNMEALVEIVRVRQTEILSFFGPLPHIRGKWSYRGQSVLIIDVRDFFGLEEHPPHEISDDDANADRHFSKTILVVKIHDHIFGLLTDRVVQVVPLIAFYEYPAMISTLPKRYFAGLTMLETGLVILLAVEDFINPYELETLLSRPDELDELEKLAQQEAG